MANSTARKAFSLGLIGTGGSLTDYNNLSASQRDGLISEAVSGVDAGNAQLTNIASDLVHRSSELNGVRNV